MIDFEAGSIVSAIFLGGTLFGGVASKLLKGAGDKAVLAYRVDKVELDVNGIGRKFREEVNTVENRLRGDLGRLQLQLKGRN